MNVNLERIMVILVIVSFAFTSINLISAQGGPITREEAIEISRNSQLVQSLLENADRYTLEVSYLNRTQVNKMRENLRWFRECCSENRSVWIVSWYIHPIGARSGFAYSVGHVIDGETGEILDEGAASIR